MLGDEDYCIGFGAFGVVVSRDVLNQGRWQPFFSTSIVENISVQRGAPTR